MSPLPLQLAPQVFAPQGIAPLSAALAAVLGFFLPALSERIVTRKSRELDVSLPPRKSDFYLLARIVSPVLAGLCTFVALAQGFSFAALESVVTVLLWILFAYIDLRIRIIPNQLVLIYLAAALAFRLPDASWPQFLLHALAMALALAVFGLSALIAGKNSVGAGDVKLAAVIGLSAGVPGIVYALLFAALSMAIVGAIGIALRRLTLKSKLPFAVFLMFGAFVSKIIELYLLI